MNILYVIRSVNHFSYEQSVIEALYKKGNNITLLFDRKWGEKYKYLKKYLKSRKEIKTGWILKRKGIFRYLLFSSREILSYISYSKRTNQSKFYFRRWFDYLPIFIRGLLIFKIFQQMILGKYSQHILEKLETIIPPDQKIVNFLQKNKPDVLVATPVIMGFSEEIEYVKAAKKMGIPVFVPVLSWDNLTTKGIFHIIPDLLLAWNQAQIKEATDIQKIPKNKIKISGAPFFDKWMDIKNLLIKKELLYKKIGLKKDKKYILYLGSSANIAKNEVWLIKKLAKTIGDINILVRPHPSNVKIYKDIGYANIKIWPKAGKLPDTDESLSDFYSCIFYSRPVVN